MYLSVCVCVCRCKAASSLTIKWTPCAAHKVNPCLDQREKPALAPTGQSDTQVSPPASLLLDAKAVQRSERRGDHWSIIFFTP